MSLVASALLRRLGPIARMLGGGWDGGGGGGSPGAGGKGTPGQLGAGEVHAWCLSPADVTDPALLQAYRHILSPPEVEALDEAKTTQVRRERLLARVLVRTTLSRYLGGVAAAAAEGGASGIAPPAPDELAFLVGEHGKPSLAAGAGWAAGALEFNLAHTPSMIMCAVSHASRPVGLDVEETGRATRSDPLRLARRRFAPGEADALEALAGAQGVGGEHGEGGSPPPPPAVVSERFIALWTLKEAHVKCAGLGISAPPGLKGFELRFEPYPGGSAALSQGTGLPAAEGAERVTAQPAEGMEEGGGGVGGGYQYLLLRPGGGHTAALCVGGSLGDPPPRVSLWRTVPMLWEEPLEGEGVEVVGCSYGDP